MHKQSFENCSYHVTYHINTNNCVKNDFRSNGHFFEQNFFQVDLFHFLVLLSVMAKATWNLVDTSALEPSHAALPTRQRRELYEKITKRFRINNDGSLEGQVADPKFATREHPIPWSYDLFTFLFFNIFVLSYFLPFVIFAYVSFYFYCYGSWISFSITIFIGLYIEFHPVSLWRECIQFPLYYIQYNYFSYRFVYHSSTKDYVTRQLMGDKSTQSLIFLGVPHAIFPYAMQLMPPIAKDILNKPIVSCMASVLYYLPIIRQLFLWTGAIDASKKSIINALSKGYNVGLVADGIAGMFVKSVKNESILLKNRKGVAKLSLQRGTSVVPTYGFGSTALFTAYIDDYGIMAKLSRQLKMSLIAFAGKYWTLAPHRMPLYYVMGPICENPNNGIPIKNPSQKQIDEYHDKILLSLKTLFDSHKGFYGWQDKQIDFI